MLKLDQFGPIYAQAHPPGDIILFKRENREKFSNGIVWLNSDQFEDKTPFNNFFRPLSDGRNPLGKPKNLNIRFNPKTACCSFEHEGLSITTEFMVSPTGTVIVMELHIKNTHQDAIRIFVRPYLIPYNNQAVLQPWDKNEWYLKSKYGEADKTVFWSQFLNQ